MAAPRGQVFRRVVSNRCPRCGRGRICPSLFGLHERCDACALVYRREHGSMTGPMYLSAAVTQIFAALAMIVVIFALDWGLALSLAVTLSATVVFCLLFLPCSRMIWIGVEYWTEVVSGDRPDDSSPSELPVADDAGDRDGG